MGRPSDQKRSARRPGKRERARIKSFRGSVSCYVPGDGIVRVKFGRKKARRVFSWTTRMSDREWREAHLSGNLDKSESESEVRMAGL